MEIKVVSSPYLIALDSNEDNNITGIYDIENDTVYLPDEVYNKLYQKLGKDPEDKDIKINIKLDCDNEINDYSDIIEIIKKYIIHF